MTKKYDLALKTGTYKTQEGLERGRYESLGEIHSGRDNGFFARINAFRMLGVAMAAIARGDDSLIISLFPPRNDHATNASPTPTQNQPNLPAAYDEDDIPY